MRIFHVLKHTMHGAGNVCAVVDLACTQARFGHDVYVCSSVGDYERLLSEHGVKSVRVNQIPGKGTLSAAWLFPSALLQLYRTLRTLKPDIVHAHMMMSTLLAAVLRPWLGFKLVTSVHNEFQPSAIVMALGQRVIGVSEAVSQSMIRRGVPSSRIRTVLNGTINSPRRPAPTPAPAPLQRPAIVTICGMHPRKGVPDLIHAYGIVAESFPEAHLYLVGSGPLQEEYECVAKQVSAKGITFCGHVEDPRPILLGADIFVLASHAEPAGLVLSEAREAGCAIVASNVGGIPEMIANGEAGILVPPRDPRLMAEALLRLLGNPSYLAEMRAKTQENIGYFTMERVTAGIDKVYGELTAAAAH